MSTTEEYPSPAEGIGLENRQGVKAPQGFESLFLRHLIFKNNQKADFIGLFLFCKNMLY